MQFRVPRTARSRVRKQTHPLSGLELLRWARSPWFLTVRRSWRRSWRPCRAHGDGCVGPAAVASHVSLGLSRAVGVQWPPELPPPTPGRSARDRRWQAASARARGRDKARSARAASEFFAGERAVSGGCSASAQLASRRALELPSRLALASRRAANFFEPEQAAGRPQELSRPPKRTDHARASRRGRLHASWARPPVSLQTAGETRSPRRISALGDGLFVPSASRP